MRKPTVQHLSGMHFHSVSTVHPGQAASATEELLIEQDLLRLQGHRKAKVRSQRVYIATFHSVLQCLAKDTLTDRTIPTVRSWSALFVKVLQIYS